MEYRIVDGERIDAAPFWRWGQGDHSDCMYSRCMAAVAEDGALIGMIFYAPFGTVQIAGVGVDPRYRRRGVATELYRAAAKAMGVRLDEIPPVDLSDDAQALRIALGMPTG